MAKATSETVPLPLVRPLRASGQFLRIVMVNDSYTPKNYPQVATVIKSVRALAETHGCVVKATMNGDFLSPCPLTSLDGGAGMVKSFNSVGFDYACLGNHEFDLKFSALRDKLRLLNATLVNSNVTAPELQEFPSAATFQVGERTVLVGGFCTGDPSIYPPSVPGSVFVPINKAITKAWADEKAKSGVTPDLFLPMTHQLTTEDRATGKMIAGHSELKLRTPFLLAGHDHEVYIEEAGASTIVKVGMDCENIAICDVWWTAEGELRRSVTMLPAAEYPPDPKAAECVKTIDDFLDATMGMPIARLEHPMSSKKVRFEASDMATFLLTLVKKGLHSQGVEVVLLIGGAVRAGADYKIGDFTMGDLFKELAFDCNQAIVDLPGYIIAESIKESRSAPKPAAGFLHCDNGVMVDPETHVVNEIDGKPIDPDKFYKVSIYQFILTGLNALQPLLSYVQEHVKVPPLESCEPIKNIAIKSAMVQAWQDVVEFDTWDVDHNGILSPEEVTTAVDKVFAKIDTANSGFIDMAELKQYLESRDGHPSIAVITKMIEALDTDGNGKIDRKELSGLACL